MGNPFQELADLQFRPQFPDGVSRDRDRTREKVSVIESTNTSLLDFNPSKRGAISNFGAVDFTAKIYNDLQEFKTFEETEFGATNNTALQDTAERLFMATSDVGSALSNFIAQAGIDQPINQIDDDFAILQDAMIALNNVTTEPNFNQFNVTVEVNDMNSAVNSIERNIDRSLTTSDLEAEILNFSELAFRNLSQKTLDATDPYPISDSVHGGPGAR